MEIQTPTTNLLRRYSKSGDVFALRTDNTKITLAECTNAIWQTQVCNSYWSAQLIAQAALGWSGDDIISNKGRFWKRTKTALQNAIIVHSDLPDSVMSTNSPRVWDTTQWDIHMETLRKSLSAATGKEDMPVSRVYATFPANYARLLGQWFSLHRDSCHWTSHSQSWKQLIAGKGFMIRGLWSTHEPIIRINHERREIDKSIIHIPQFTNYVDPERPGLTQHVVRALVQPLDNGFLAFYNGYKARINHSTFDFTTTTRHMMEEVNGDVLPSITQDFVKYFGQETGVLLGVKQVLSAYSNAYVNGDKWYIVGPVDHPIIVRNTYNRRHFHDVVTLPENYEEDSYGESESNYLDYGWTKTNADNTMYAPLTEYGFRWGSYDRRNQ